MAETRYDVIGIGNALVDVLVSVEDDFLGAEDLPKGGMMLVEADQSDALYAKLGPATERSGGSCGNTMAGLAALGGAGAYIGKVRDDAFGQVFRHDLSALGVAFETAPAGDAAPTGKCLVLVSPDAQRTMVTYLGAATELTPADIDADAIQAAKVLYLEGYLFDRDEAKAAFAKAAEIAHAADREVSLTLSDGFCVDRHRAAFRHLVEGHVDILFANEDEIKSLYEVDTFEEALDRVRGHCKIACLTRSEKGSVVVTADATNEVPAEAVDTVLDTTGAGDQYAAGFLYGYTQGMDLARAGRIGGIAAAEVIGHYGARPEVDLKALVAEKLGG